MARATDRTSESEINSLNRLMRGQPWYQAFFASRGLNPNRVQLSKDQRNALRSLASQNGFDLGSGMTFDPAGNINQQGGYAGLPGWAKAAIIGGAALTGAGAAGFGPLSGILGLGGSSAPAAGVAAGGVTPAVGGFSAVPAATAAAGGGMGSVGSLLGLGGGGFSVSDIVRSVAGPGISGVTGLLATRSQNRAMDRATDAQVQAAREAADLQARSAADQLAFARAEADRQQQNYRETQDRNFGLYQAAQARLAPYRRLGESAIAAFGRPITVGSALGIV